MTEDWVGRRVHGSERGDPVGPEEGHAYVELVGGPLTAYCRTRRRESRKTAWMLRC
ncbi:hypothetical protein [Streptomyces sp. NPDC054854]